VNPISIERKFDVKNAVFIAIALCAIMLLSYHADAQWVKPEHITFSALELRAKEIRHSVFAVQVEGNQKNEEKRDDWLELGTGFFVKRKDNVFLGVTCRHIVLMTRKMKKEIYVGFDDKNHGYIRLRCAVDYVEQKYDVAILRPKKGGYKNVDPASLAFSREQIGSNEDLVPGRGVLIPGYPLGLGVSIDENYPVFRFGIIAQYSGANFFLIDGVASHGNSGSPVFCLKELKVVGLIGAHKTDRISLFDENGEKVAALPYNAGLAQAIAPEVIGNILDMMNKNVQPNDPH